MKYIRTKDYVALVECDFNGAYCIKDNQQNWHYVEDIEKDIINQADTIEELCDEFVVADGDQIATFRNLKIAKSTKGDLYGNIIVNGLSHSVAKMNKEGVFELL